MTNRAVADRSSSRLNNFDAVRLAGAGAVIVGHAFELTGHGSAPRLLDVPIHVLGVQVFFVMSGYLIARSWIRQPRIFDYLRNRALRILPGLAVVVVLSFAVLGPLVTTLSVGQYFSDPLSWRYLMNVVLRPVFDLPGVFTGLPFSDSVNGSLWTLPIEFLCYLVVPLLLVFKRTRFAAVIAFGIVGVLIDELVSAPLVIYGTSIQRASDLFTFFAAGMLIALLRRGFLRMDVALVLLVLQVAVASIADPLGSRVVLWITLPYIVLAFCVASTPILRRAARWGDLSYGLYIYAFPIQQLVLFLVPPLPLAVNIGAVFILSAVAAFLSWHLVEKMAMKLRAKGGAQPAARERELDLGPDHSHIRAVHELPDTSRLERL